MVLLGKVFYTYYEFTKPAPSKTNFDSNEVLISLFFLIKFFFKLSLIKFIDYKDVFVMIH